MLLTYYVTVVCEACHSTYSSNENIFFHCVFPCEIEILFQDGLEKNLV